MRRILSISSSSSITWPGVLGEVRRVADEVAEACVRLFEIEVPLVYRLGFSYDLEHFFPKRASSTSLLAGRPQIYRIKRFIVTPWLELCRFQTPHAQGQPW